ncbi:putative serine/threonine-protein kinase wnk11 [Castilleja foliolosa]|uniref:non-specific serine/threonine protein kinase n=1 Tax=Castilleja foliolosa TaxID=1961234 RepID=A0ABD3C6A4_9LAMI
MRLYSERDCDICGVEITENARAVNEHPFRKSTAFLLGNEKLPDAALGSGAVKKVYRAFDHEEGIEVAWNQVKLRNFSDDELMINRLFSEVRLLRDLRNKNIIALYSVWRDKEKNTLNFITEVCTSGNLREYRKKHKQVSMKALKKWSRQILKGLDYLHTHEPCVIHRDLNCSNVIINGNVHYKKTADLRGNFSSLNR